MSHLSISFVIKVHLFLWKFKIFLAHAFLDFAQLWFSMVLIPGAKSYLEKVIFVTSPQAVNCLIAKEGNNFSQCAFICLRF